MSDERIVKLDVGCRPEAAISGAFLLQSESDAILVFNAMSIDRDADGHCSPLGLAIVTFAGLRETRFGGANDEARAEHPLYHKGMRELGYAVCEVLGSRWASESAARAEATARRIHGARFAAAYAGHDFRGRHFLCLFHDSMFECLADDLRIELSGDPFDQVVRRCAEKIVFSPTA